MGNKNPELKKWGLLIILVLIGYWIVNNIDILGNILGTVLSILYPFIFGACLAFVLNIPMTFFEKKLLMLKNKKKKNIIGKKLARIISLLFAIIVITLVVILIITLIVPELINVIVMLIERIPYLLADVKELISEYDLNGVNLNSFNINEEEIKSYVFNELYSVLTSSISILTGIVSATYNFIIGLIFAIYILLDKEKLKNQAKNIIKVYCSEKKERTILKLADVSNNIFKRFFTVQCLEAFILGILCIIGMLILGIPYAIPIGILVGVTALIPIVGAFIGVIIGAILIVAVAPIKVITFIIFFLILQQIEGNLIYPKVVGTSIGLPGMWVLAAVTVGGSLGGIIGMLLGVPIVSIIYTLLKEDVYNKLNQDITDIE